VLRFRVKGLGFRVYCQGLRVKGMRRLGFRTQDSGLRV
jgi:hypothetical protein